MTDDTGSNPNSNPDPISSWRQNLTEETKTAAMEIWETSKVRLILNAIFATIEVVKIMEDFERGENGKLEASFWKHDPEKGATKATDIILNYLKSAYTAGLKDLDKLLKIQEENMKKMEKGEMDGD